MKLRRISINEKQEKELHELAETFHTGTLTGTITVLIREYRVLSHRIDILSAQIERHEKIEECLKTLKMLL